MYRARPPFGGDANRFVCDYMGGPCDQGKCGFGYGPKNRLLIQNLMCVALRFVRIDRTRQNDHWDTILMSIGNRVNAVQSPGSNGCHKNARCACAMVYTLGHESCCVFVFGENESDAGSFQRVNKRKDLSSWHSEGVSASCLKKSPCQRVRGSNMRLCCHWSTRLENLQTGHTA